MYTTMKTWLRKIRHLLNQSWVPALVFILAALLTLTQSFREVFHDEGDILTVGWLLTKNQVLYRDVFSHHFPLPYFWSAGVTLLFGRSLPAQRLAIFTLTVVIFLAAARLSRRPLAVSLGFLFWSLFSHLVRGNMVLYHTFGALSLFVVFIILFRTLKNPESLSWGTGLLLGFAASVAILGSVIYLYPILIALIFLAISQVQWDQQRSLKARLTNLAHRLWPVLAGGLVLPLLFLVYLLAHQAVGDFWREGIRFNLDFYSPHINASDMSPLQVLVYTVAFHNPLQVLAPPLNPHWTFNYILFISVRLCALASVGIMAARRQYLRAAFTYLFLAALLVRNNGPNGQPYLMIALYLLPAVLLANWLPRSAPPASAPSARPPWMTTLGKGLQITGICLLGILFLAFGRLFINTLKQPENLTPTHNFGPALQEAEHLQAIRERCPGTEILAYPFDMTLYYLSGIKPASRYLFMLPWVDDYATPDIIADLREDRPILVSYDLEVFYYRPEALLEFLEKNYIQADETIWHSPSLEHCLTQKETQP